MLPPRPVSPTKMLGDSDSDEPTLAEKLLESQDEVAYLTSENSDLKRRIEELEGSHLQQTRDRATESEKDAEIARLVQANQELLVVIKNADSESEMKRQEMRFKREVEKRTEIERRLRDEVEFERGVSGRCPLLCSPVLTLTLDSASPKWSVSSSPRYKTASTSSPVDAPRSA